MDTYKKDNYRWDSRNYKICWNIKEVEYIGNINIPKIKKYPINK